MHIFYQTIGITIGWVLAAYMVGRMIMWITRASIAITKDHNGYVDDLEAALTDAELRAKNAEDMFHDYLKSMEAEKEIHIVQAARRAEMAAKMNGDPDRMAEWAFEHDTQSWKPVGPWAPPTDGEMESAGYPKGVE